MGIGVISYGFINKLNSKNKEGNSDEKAVNGNTG
jgi:hypothetical protein